MMHREIVQYRREKSAVIFFVFWSSNFCLYFKLIENFLSPPMYADTACDEFLDFVP